jgi:hypothetical protein
MLALPEQAGGLPPPLPARAQGRPPVLRLQLQLQQALSLEAAAAAECSPIGPARRGQLGDLNRGLVFCSGCIGMRHCVVVAVPLHCELRGCHTLMLGQENLYQHGSDSPGLEVLGGILI